MKPLSLLILITLMYLITKYPCQKMFIINDFAINDNRKLWNYSAMYFRVWFWHFLTSQGAHPTRTRLYHIEVSVLQSCTPMLTPRSGTDGVLSILLHFWNIRGKKCKKRIENSLINCVERVAKLEGKNQSDSELCNGPESCLDGHPSQTVRSLSCPSGK